ncbi:acylneuraminate cytidylyltransferase family protein [Lentisphaerota bacterium WC36G]|nr:acylneuraminate cytidylyltransferase family protein [Lentisphaerae bacterium WC36]
MYKNNRILAVITARGGSQRLPKKNIMPLAGKPLIAWSISSAKKSRYLDKIIVSSDCDNIVDVAKSYGAEVPFKRPKSLATSTASGIDPVKHAVEFLQNIGENFDVVVLLQPTSPFRTAKDIDNAIELLIDNFNNNVQSVVSFVEPDKKINWHYYFDSANHNKVVNISANKQNSIKRVENTTAYCLNGAVYVIKCEVLMTKECSSFISENTIGYLMDKYNSMDIDTELDFKFCEFLLQQQSSKSEG